jgi:hypothetical protein
MAKVAAALLAGLIGLLLLFPASGIDPIPPQCFSIFNYNVPCEGWMAPLAAAATAATVYLVVRLRDRRR